MFCPKCRYEYIQGVYKCPECEVDLVDQLPEKSGKSADEPDLVKIYKPDKPGELPLVKTIFEQEGIEYFEFGNYYGDYSNRRPNIWVKREDAERARQLLIDLANSRVDETDGEGN
jgi:hypothetical protein